MAQAVFRQEEQEATARLGYIVTLGVTEGERKGGKERRGMGGRRGEGRGEGEGESYLVQAANAE